MKKLLITLFLPLFLAACGGGGDTSSDGGTPSSQQSVSANGYWTGTYTETGAGTSEIRGFTVNGKIAFQSTQDDFISGSYVLSGNEFTGTISTIYAGATSVIKGSVVEGKTITAEFLSDGYTVGTLELSYDDTYDKATSISDATGSWSYSSDSNSYTSSITVYDNGTFDGSDSDGCVFAGQLEDIDDKNVFKVTNYITGCTTVTLTGFSAIADSYNPNDVFFAITNNSNNGDYSVFYK